MMQATGTVRLANAGQCTLDTFSVGNPSGPSPPTICGVNTGQHSEHKISNNATKNGRYKN